ncbi:hypothetical protein [Streptomyces avermitilis]|uniref:hypothetical protein n=1 Tax=Streptomyces avermitilis TaxID=33903 RepID=UPI0038276DCC
MAVGSEYNVRRSYRDLIYTAYENVAIVPADPVPDHVKNGQFEISGKVKTGNDERDRGTRRAAPLRIDGRRGDWSEIETLWLAGDLRDDDFEDRFIDDAIVADIGEGTDGWEFNGDSYAVELRPRPRASPTGAAPARPPAPPGRHRAPGAAPLRGAATAGRSASTSLVRPATRRCTPP